MSTLAATVAQLKAGDRITAQFRDSYTVTGIVRQAQASILRELDPDLLFIDTAAAPIVRYGKDQPSEFLTDLTILEQDAGVTEDEQFDRIVRLVDDWHAVVSEQANAPASQRDAKQEAVEDAKQAVLTAWAETNVAKAAPAIVVDFGLTPRESEILRFLAEGKSRKDIAAELTVSPNTVRTHVQSILKKTKTNSALAAVAAARKAGLDLGSAA